MNKFTATMVGFLAALAVGAGFASDARAAAPPPCEGLFCNPAIPDDAQPSAPATCPEGGFFCGSPAADSIPVEPVIVIDPCAQPNLFCGTAGTETTAAVTAEPETTVEESVAEVLPSTGLRGAVWSTAFGAVLLGGGFFLVKLSRRPV